MRILYVTTISLTINSFFKPHIQMLAKEGHTVDIACNATDLPLDELYRELGCRFFQIDFSRSPLSPSNGRAYKQLSNVIKNGHYDIVHCHTPNASVITRLVCRTHRKKNGLKVFYTAHGFHFFKGAPMLNWMVYYPVEKWCSRYTDKLITINKEDYALAKRKFKAGQVYYVPGVGVDLSAFEHPVVDKGQKRRELGISEEDTLLLSVGELNDNKNHQVILRAIAQLQDPTVHYVLAGTGANAEMLSRLAETLGIEKQIHLLGYRRDIPELCVAADIFCFPSRREGLAVSPMEAMASGLPVVASDIRGVNDYIQNEVNGYLCSPNDAQGFAKALEALKTSLAMHESYSERNRQAVERFRIHEITRMLADVYKGVAVNSEE